MEFCHDGQRRKSLSYNSKRSTSGRKEWIAGDKQSFIGGRDCQMIVYGNVCIRMQHRIVAEISWSCADGRIEAVVVTEESKSYFGADVWSNWSRMRIIQSDNIVREPSQVKYGTEWEDLFVLNKKTKCFVNIELYFNEYLS